MMNQWRNFLIARGARIDEQSSLSFPASQTTSDCRLFDLSHLGLIAVRGADAKTYLQGQLTNDIRELSESNSQLSAHCSQKGRMLALLRVFQVGDTLYLQTPAERLPEIIKRLRIYILRSKVNLEDASDALVRIGLAGDGAPDLLTARGLPAPEQENRLALSGEFAVIRIPGTPARFEVLAPYSAMTGLWEHLAEQAAPADAQDWTLLDIQAGLPNVYDLTAEAFVPQMTNLHLIHGVSFHKGCYTGQEVVARMQFLGKLKRRMYLAEVTAETPPKPGDELFSPASTSQQASGRVVDVAPIAPGRYALLVVAEIASADGGEVRLGESGPLLSLSEPPYGFMEAT
ncbi:CAF17-like 4Fe-4S cluster assembly/insertion protein YgfZ [Thiocystis violacea]|uniref:CAF17-like 4Fe-4S cluster assembly/insertion protein YgfZ n=1 Tax=Thiocystis violacea TaxID=13725 RepID=UPI001907AD6A|nr:folate-binding protein YgfZ [Thiocystis violacea]MBK1723438.1 folate-binding protein YgfZ [Thiocystis violacea]